MSHSLEPTSRTSNAISPSHEGIIQTQQERSCFDYFFSCCCENIRSATSRFFSGARSEETTPLVQSITQHERYETTNSSMETAEIVRSQEEVAVEEERLYSIEITREQLISTLQVYCIDIIDINPHDFFSDDNNIKSIIEHLLKDKKMIDKFFEKFPELEDSIKRIIDLKAKIEGYNKTLKDETDFVKREKISRIIEKYNNKLIDSLESLIIEIKQSFQQLENGSFSHNDLLHIIRDIEYSEETIQFVRTVLQRVGRIKLSKINFSPEVKR